MLLSIVSGVNKIHDYLNVRYKFRANSVKRAINAVDRLLKGAPVANPVRQFEVLIASQDVLSP